jgi:hypothetical protein
MNKKESLTLNNISSAILEKEGSALFYTPAIYKNSKSYLFHKPAEILEARNAFELNKSLQLIQKLLNKGLTGYGYINKPTI